MKYIRVDYLIQVCGPPFLILIREKLDFGEGRRKRGGTQSVQVIHQRRWVRRSAKFTGTDKGWFLLYCVHILMDKLWFVTPRFPPA